MQIQVNTDNHIVGSAELTRQVEAVVAGALGRFGDRITRVEVHLADDNSRQKFGDNDKRCVMEARLAGLQPITVSHQGSSVEQALAGAADTLEKTLKRTLERKDSLFKRRARARSELAPQKNRMNAAVAMSFNSMSVIRLSKAGISPRTIHEIRSMNQIHHFSIPVQDTPHVAEVLQDLFGGTITPFGPYPNSYIVWFGDEHGSAIELFPMGTEMFPDAADGQANFRHNPSHTGFTATHAAISINRSREEIFEVANENGWKAAELSRGSFNVIEFWIENRIMIELLTPDLAQHYLAATKRYKPST